VVEESDVIRAAIADLAVDLQVCEVVGLCKDVAAAAAAAARETPHLVLLRSSLATVDNVRQIRASAPGCLVYPTDFRCARARAAEARLLGADGCLEIARLGPELARLMAGSDYPNSGSRGPAD
jgi:DNA-binding NarL/FixJ family response regulator